MMSLVHALRLEPRSRVALVGAGGKTTTLFNLARRLAPSVLITATTHLATSQLQYADQHYVIHFPEDIDSIGKQLAPGSNLFVGPSEDVQRTGAIDPASLERVRILSEKLEIPLLIEADGSRQLPLKAPAEHEPPIPDFVDTVVLVAGLSGLGKTLDDRHVHRSERFASLSGLKQGSPITWEALLSIIVSPNGGLKNIPPSSRRCVLLNQADDPSLICQAQKMSAHLLPPFHSVVIASQAGFEAGQDERIHSVHEPVAGVVLAAGQADRFGMPKQTLLWRGRPMVRAVTETALQAGLSPVIVVVGAYRQAVTDALVDLPVIIVHNPDWNAGQSSSLKTGLQALPPETGAAIFLLADQPRVPVELLHGLCKLHSENLSSLVAPRVNDRRANPVLFDRRTFPALSSLEGDLGGRALFEPNHTFSVSWLPWLDEGLLMDVDTPDDYRRLTGTE
jgi:molybdenum cofactor cytidylyltransferase